MKKLISFIFTIILCLSLAACSESEAVKSDENLIESSDTTKTLVEQINDQLTGTWTSNSSDSVIQKWTFHDGKYVVDVYIDGELLDNSTVGTYSIGEAEIHTITIDQKNNVEGSIPFTFKNGILVLHGASGDLTKEK